MNYKNLHWHLRIRRLYNYLGYCLAFSFASLLLAGCSQQTHFTLTDVPPLVSHDHSLSAQQASQQTENLNLRQLSTTSKNFFERYISTDMRQKQIAIQLHNIIHSPAFLDFEYAYDKSLTAQQAFDQAQGNCLGYSHLYLSLARHFGLRARYQLVETDPTLVLKNKRISLTIHINVVVSLPDGSSYVADTVPNKHHLIKRGKLISDEQADALHYNNLAINFLHEQNIEDSYRHLAKSFSLNADLSLLWSNIGALYRKNQQHGAAETSYRNALKLDHDAYAALNNLAVLFHKQGDQSRTHYYLNKIRAYRDQNPYHHYNLALLEVNRKNYSQALRLVKKSIRLKKQEPEFYYQKSLIYELLDDFKNSQQAILEAIAHSQDPKRIREFETRAKDIKQHINTAPPIDNTQQDDDDYRKGYLWRPAETIKSTPPSYTFR